MFASALPSSILRVAAAASLATGAAIALPGLASAASAPSSGCADVQVMVSRGTGEGGTIGSMQVVATAITTGTSKTVSTWGNPYPAGIDFTSSAATGTTDLVNQMTSQATACPSQKFVLLGYSQGAMAVGDALGGGLFSSSKVSSSVGSHVAAVVLWGNPYFNSAESFDAGTYTKGVNGTWARTTGSLKAYQDKILDYCLKDDGVCQGNGSTTINAGHLSYSTNSTVTSASSNFALKKLSGSSTTPVTSPTTPVTSPSTQPTTPTTQPTTPATSPTTPSTSSAWPSGGFDFFGWIKSLLPWL